MPRSPMRMLRVVCLVGGVAAPAAGAQRARFIPLHHTPQFEEVQQKVAAAKRIWVRTDGALVELRGPGVFDDQIRFVSAHPSGLSSPLSLWMVREIRTRGRGTGRGAVIGGIAGGVVGALVGYSVATICLNWSGSCSASRTSEGVGGMLIGAVGGAVGGALLGAAVGSLVPRWKVVWRAREGGADPGG